MKFLYAHLAAAALALAGCSTSKDASTPPEAPDIPGNDVSFIDGMVPHHQRAIDMANEEVARGASPDVKAMAQMMATVQQQEIQQLEGIRVDVAGAQSTARVSDPHGDADMAELQSLSGTDLDLAFLDNMIPHHAAAVVMSHRALPNLDRSDLVDFAHKTIDDQTSEMKKMLDMKHDIDASR